MKRLAALGFLSAFVVMFINVLALALGSASAEAAGCAPQITSITPVSAAYSGSGRIDIAGSCFGTASPFVQEDRAYLRLSDLTPGTQLPASSWNACWTGDPGTDTITCDVGEWTDTHITFNGFNGAFGFGGYHFSAGDRLAVQVWNAQSLNGPAVQLVPIASAPAQAPQTNNINPGGTPISIPDADNRAVHNAHVNSIARTLASPRHAFANVSSDVVNATIAVAAALFITFPANLFNQTFEENYADIRAWWRRRFRWLTELRRPAVVAAVTREEGVVRWPAFATVVLGGALLGGLLDPHFGANARTLISVLALATAITAGIAVPALTAEVFHRARKDETRIRIRALPAGLAIAAVCVLLSRITGFQPGYLYGIVAGVAFGRALAKREQAHLIILSTIAVIVVSVLAWIGWAAINGSAEDSGASDVLVWLDEALAAMFVAGLVGSVISMLPLRFLPGQTLKSWSRAAWVATFSVALFGLVQVLLRPHATEAGPSHTPLVTTILLFVLFAAATVAFRWHFVQKRMREEGATATGWQQVMRHLLGGEQIGPVQLAATTDGVSLIELPAPQPALQPAAKPEPERVIDLTEPQPSVSVPAQRTPPRKRTTTAAKTTTGARKSTTTTPQPRTTRKPPVKKS